MEKEYRHNNKVAIYRSADGETQLSVEIDKDTVWLNANQMAELFGRDSKTIRKHINNAIREELAGEVVVAKFATTELSNSSFNALLICFPIVFTSLPNNSANCFLLSHTVLFFKGTVNFISLSAVSNKINSFSMFAFPSENTKNANR